MRAKEKKEPPISSYEGEEAHYISQIFGPPSFPGATGRVGKYELISQIGMGGMGVAYSGMDISSPTPSTLAIKLLKPQYIHSPQAREYFRKEALHMQILKHRNILPLIEFDDAPACPYLVMPYIQEGSLADFLHRKPTLAQILTVLKQVSGALAFAHQRGVFHCDVKPTNILIDSKDRAYLMDFGLARSLFSTPAFTGEGREIEGTPQYQSPGIAAGHYEDCRADIYSFGAVLYEILTGVPPYYDVEPDQILQSIREGPPKPILEINPCAHPGLVAICELSMARSLRQRYAHMDYCTEDSEKISIEPEMLKMIGTPAGSNG